MARSSTKYVARFRLLIIFTVAVPLAFCAERVLAQGGPCLSGQHPPARWRHRPRRIRRRLAIRRLQRTDREVGCAGTSAPAQPGALSRCPGAQCRISSFGGAELFGVAGRFIGGGLYGFPLSSSLRLGLFIGAGFRRGCDALSELWWPTWSGSGAERSGLDRPLFERGWFSGRTSGYRNGSSSATARIGSGLLS